MPNKYCRRGQSLKTDTEQSPESSKPKNSGAQNPGENLPSQSRVCKKAVGLCGSVRVAPAYSPASELPRVFSAPPLITKQCYP